MAGSKNADVATSRLVSPPDEHLTVEQSRALNQGPPNSIMTPEQAEAIENARIASVDILAGQILMDVIAAHPGVPSREAVEAMSTERKLEELAHWQRKIADKVTDIDAEIRRLQEERKKAISVEAAICDDLEQRIKKEVIAAGHSIRAGGLVASWCKGRAGAWSNEGLTGYSVAHPEILKFKSPNGEPYAKIEEDRTKKK